MQRGRFPPSALKGELRQAVSDADDWVEANAAAYNSSLSQPFRGKATAVEKMFVLAYVLAKRIGEQLDAAELRELLGG